MAGRPTHFELGVSSAGRARTFYSGLLGWTFHTMGDGDEAWIETGGVNGGVHENDPQPGIVVYFTVPDIEAALETVSALGGQPGTPSAFEPGFGRFAECLDDQGAKFGLHQSS
jgi:predicted enzyme related to lactoylglutathione lyase